METLALHFRFNFHALRFHVITFVLTYSPECSLCVIITTAGEEEEGAESNAFSSGGTKPKHHAAPRRRQLCAVGTALLLPCHPIAPCSHGVRLGVHRPTPSNSVGQGSAAALRCLFVSNVFYCWMKQ